MTNGKPTKQQVFDAITKGLSLTDKVIVANAMGLITDDELEAAIQAAKAFSETCERLRIAIDPESLRKAVKKLKKKESDERV